MKKILILLIIPLVLSLTLSAPTAIATFPISSDTVTFLSNTTTTPQEDFPTLTIQANGIPFVERTLWIDSRFDLTGMERDNLNFSGAMGRIRGRGASSWSNHPEKRSLRLRFNSGNRAMVASGPRHRDWVLIANHGDKSLLRNYTAYHLGNKLDGMCWAPFARFMHLYVNDEYMGVYMLADERSIGPGRANLEGHSDPALTDYFIEQDSRLYRGGNIEGIHYIRVNTHPNGITGNSRSGGTARDNLYEVRFPNNATPEHLEYARDFLDRVGRAMRSRDFERVAALVDIPSMVDFMLVQQIFVNTDAGWNSVFMKIRGQGDERKLHMAPVWDFDIAAQNAYWTARTEPRSALPRNTWYWAVELFAIPEFRQAVAERWHHFARQAVDETIEHVRELSLRYQTAFEHNFERHDILGVFTWPNPPHVAAIDTWTGQVDFMLGFLEQRADYFDEILPRPEPSQPSSVLYSNFEHCYYCGVTKAQIITRVEPYYDREFAERIASKRSIEGALLKNCYGTKQLYLACQT
ncbi:MAG: CotH kinase family protein [Oscillospiraceae bacterium]|nr:CotH kinase family protein [Oscillospiraceae bacterium]